jgi:hypothetical protein
VFNVLLELKYYVFHCDFHMYIFTIQWVIELNHKSSGLLLKFENRRTPVYVPFFLWNFVIRNKIKFDEYIINN